MEGHKEDSPKGETERGVWDAEIVYWVDRYEAS
jgi:hypothetical protein